MYPSTRYHPTKDPVIVKSAEEDMALGDGWFKSPADYGVETCPSREPDPAIAAKKIAPRAPEETPAPVVAPVVVAIPKKLSAFAILKQRFLK